MTRNALEVKNVSKKYAIQSAEQQRYKTLYETLDFRHLFKRNRARLIKKEFSALDDISFTVKEGDCVGIIGSNGAGKSTLLKILSQITEPTSGAIGFNGRIASLLEVGTGFHPELTGRENIFLNGTILGMKRAEILNRFDEIVEFSGIEKFLDVPVKRYSSGMYVRLAFSVAAHLECEILVVDEVLAVGDAAFQKKCIGKMNEKAKEGRTVLFVSHNMPTIRSLCNRALLLDGGKLMMDGDTSEVLNKYLEIQGRVLPSIEWDGTDAPGNDFFRCLSIKMDEGEGFYGGRAPNDQPIHIEIEHEVLADQTIMGLTLSVKTLEGEIIFSSINNHDVEWHGKARQKGRYKSICTIPDNLLLDGIYTISINMWGAGYTMNVPIENAISFEIYDTGSLRKDYFGGWGGVIRPKLEWTTRHIPTSLK
ncbi:MAG: ABC transporter ATP-binding protein [Micavibrio sp.]